MLQLNNYLQCDSLTFFILVRPLLQHSPTLLRFLNDPWVEIGKIFETILCFPALSLPPSPCAFCLTHSISLPFVPRGVCCRPRCLNLGVRTHRATGVYSTATPVKNTLPWKYSHGVHSKTPRKIRPSAKQVQVHAYGSETFPVEVHEEFCDG